MFLSDVAIHSILTLCGVTGMTFASLHFLCRSDSRIDQRIKSEVNLRTNSRIANSRFRQRLIAAMVRLLPSAISRKEADQGEQNGLEDRFRRAGIYGKQAVPIYAACTLALAILPSVVVVILLSTHRLAGEKAIWIALIGGGAGMFLPSLWLDRRTRQRHQMLTTSLPDFLDLMVTCLTSGLSFEASLRRVSVEIGNAHPQLQGELKRVQKEMDLGASVDQAILNFSERSDCSAVRSLAAISQQARQFGTKISDALRAHSDLLRTQREMIAEERAQKAAVKMLFPVLVFIFPSVFVVLAGPAAIQIWENLASPAAATSGNAE